MRSWRWEDRVHRTRWSVAWTAGLGRPGHLEMLYGDATNWEKRGTPSIHSFLDGNFPYKPSRNGGYPHDYGNPHMEVWAKIAITKTKKCLSTHISAIYGSIIVQHSPAMEQEDPTIYSMSWSKNGGLTRSLIDNLNGTVADQPLDLGHLVFRQKTGHSMFIV